MENFNISDNLKVLFTFILSNLLFILLINSNLVICKLN